MDWMNVFESLLRWAHIVAAILWVGMLYFFNFVNASFSASLDADTKRRVAPALMTRVLFWFRWGAFWTWILGFLLVSFVYYHRKTYMFEPDGESGWGLWPAIMLVITYGAFHGYDLLAKSLFADGRIAFVGGFVLTTLFAYGCKEAGFTYRSISIHVGVLFGTIMASNVWFRIWPAQRRILAAIEAGEEPDAGSASLAATRSRHNTYMSVPVVFLMMGQHGTWASQAFDLPSPALLGLVILVGWLFTGLLYGKAAKLGGPR